MLTIGPTMIRICRSRFEKTCSIKDIYDGFMNEFVLGGMGMFFEAFARIAVNIRSKE